MTSGSKTAASNRLFSQHLRRTEDGRYQIVLGRDTAIVEIDDAPYVVTALDGDLDHGLRVRLNDTSEEALSPDTLSIGPDNAVYCRVQRPRRVGPLHPAGLLSAGGLHSGRTRDRRLCPAPQRRRLPHPFWPGPPLAAPASMHIVFVRARDSPQQRHHRAAVRGHQHRLSSGRPPGLFPGRPLSQGGPASTTGRMSSCGRTPTGPTFSHQRPGPDGCWPSRPGPASPTPGFAIGPTICSCSAVRRAACHHPFGPSWPASLYTIPMPGRHVRSLNLSNAAAIVLYEALRQLGHA